MAIQWVSAFCEDGLLGRSSLFYSFSFALIFGDWRLWRVRYVQRELHLFGAALFIIIFNDTLYMDLILKYFPDLSPLQISQFERLGELYEMWNGRINVISRKDIGQLYLHHVLHSLAVARCGKIEAGQRVLDVGCGGGFPGIPLAILYPDTHFTMVDSIGKKIMVVREVAAALELSNVEAVHARVESCADGGYEWVVSRAVTDLKTFVGWTWRKCTCGVLYLKGGDLSEEIRQANVPTVELPISDWFDEGFFDTKKVLVLSKGKSRR